MGGATTNNQAVGAGMPAATRVGGAALPLLAIALTALNLRTAVSGFSPLLDTIGAELGFGASVYGLLGTIVTACFAVFGLVAPIVARRIGLEQTIVIATALTAIGILARALSDDPIAVVVSMIVAFAGVGTSNVIIIPLVKKYFAEHLKAVSSGYLALLQVGQFVAPLIAIPVATAYGWRFAIGVWAAPVAIAVVLWIVFALRQRRATSAARAGSIAAATAGGGGAQSGHVADAAPEPAAPVAAPVHAPAGAWSTALLWSMVLMFGMTSLNTYAIFTWFPTILVDAGADPATSGSLLALFSIFGLLAAFVVPPLTLRLHNPFVIVVVCVAFLAVGYLGLMLWPIEGSLAWAVCLGLGVSTFPFCLTLVNARTNTPGGSSALSGAMQGAGYAIACIGPFCIGALYSMTNSWTSSYVLLFATLAVMLAAGYVACKPRLLEDILADRA